jgi:hypothetical protein
VIDRATGAWPLALAAAALAAWPAAARAGEPLALGDPARPLLVDARLVVDARPAAPDRASRLPGPRPPVEWRTSGSALLLETRGDGWQALLRVTRDRRGALIEAEIRYSAPVVVGRESIQLVLPGRARALARDLRVAPLIRPLRVDRGTPVWIATEPTGGHPGAALVAEEGIPAARFIPHRGAPAAGASAAAHAGALGGPGAATSTGRAWAARGGATRVELVLDDPEVHPFAPYAACRAVYLPHLPGEPPPLRPAPELERRVRHDRVARAAGDVVRARARLYLVEPGQEFLPLIVERWADGARAAVVFTDHADRTDPDALRAVLYGASDLAAEAAPRGGFFGHGVRITKTFFLRPGVGSLEEDADARRLAGQIVAHGSEVGSHSITPQRDPRAVVAASIGAFSPWGAVTWIDHQPDTNCEAITSRGWRDEPTWGIHDLLAGAGFRWVWSATDVPERVVGVQNVFSPERAAARPPIYPLPSDPRLWAFDSSWFYGPIGRMADALSDAELDRLQRERGLFVAHTYLSASPRTTRRRDLIGRDAVVPRAEGGFAIDPGFDQALSRLGERIARGALASLTLRECAERLRQLDRVSVRYRPDGAAVVSNAGTSAIHGLTVAIPAEVDADVDGGARRGSRNEPGRTMLWFNLPAGASVVIAARAVPSSPWGRRADETRPIRLGAGRPVETGRAP